MLIFTIFLMAMLKNWCQTFLIKESMCFIMKAYNFYLKLGLKFEKIHRVSEFNQSQWQKPYVEFNRQKKNRSRKNGVKDGKVMYKLMSNALYDKTIE